MAERELPREYKFNGRTYKPHPAADCFPLMAGAAYKDLVDDIRENGMLNPILVLGEYVLDGRNRILAGLEAGISVFEVKELPRDTDAIAVVASINIHRRHLTASQRSMAAAHLMALAKAAYMDNNPGAPDPDLLPPDDDLAGLASGSGDAEDPSPDAAPAVAARADAVADLPPLPDGGSPADLMDDENRTCLSQDKVADAYGVSRASVTRADQVQQSAPELQASVRDGVINLHDALRIQHEPEDVRRQAVQDVVDGKAETASRAIRQRYSRDPVGGSNGGSAAASPSLENLSGELAVPPALFAHVRTLLGEISFDPCSSSWCADRLEIPEWCGLEGDGLLADWHGSVWVFPPPDRAEPFLVKTLLEIDAGRVSAAAVLVPMEPWSDATVRAFASPSFEAVVVPATPLSCKRPDGSAVRPPDPLWLILFGRMKALPADVLGPFASAVLVSQLASEPAS